MVCLGLGGREWGRGLGEGLFHLEDGGLDELEALLVGFGEDWVVGEVELGLGEELLNKGEDLGRGHRGEGRRWLFGMGLREEEFVDFIENGGSLLLVYLSVGELKNFEEYSFDSSNLFFQF